MKKKPLAALFLTLALILGMMAGCGEAPAASSPAEESIQASAEASASSAAVEEPSVAPEQEPLAEDSQSVPEAAEDPQEPEGEPVYGNYRMANPDLTPFPANDSTVISVWTTMPLSFVRLESSGDVLA